jgi:NADPH:quinone reductase-like Zn-dependent oxidoreductase
MNAQITFLDPDVVEMKNVFRQNFGEAEVGGHKAELLALHYSAPWGMTIQVHVARFEQGMVRLEYGDPVFASAFAINFGGYAEYECLRENGVIAIKPANLTFEQAAAVPGAGQTALQCLKKGKIQRGRKVLVYGASGAVGTYAVQIASRHLGTDVTGVCSGANLELVKSLGASQVIDYTQKDLTSSSETYDVIFDAVGKLAPAFAKKILKPGGATSTSSPTPMAAISLKTCSYSKNSSRQASSNR